MYCAWSSQLKHSWVRSLGTIYTSQEELDTTLGEMLAPFEIRRSHNQHWSNKLERICKTSRDPTYTGSAKCILNSTLLGEIISTNNLPYSSQHSPTRGKVDANKETEPFSDH